MSPFMGGGSNSGLAVVVWIFIIAGFLGYLSFRFAIAMVLRKFLNALPEEYREPPEALIWLNIVLGLPCLINFFVFPMLARSYQKALEARQLGDIAGLKYLQLLAWLYPVLYLLAFLPYVAPTMMPDKLDSMFEVYVYLAVMFSDLPVLVFVAIRFQGLEKHVRVENAGDSHVSARHRNVLKRLSRE